MNALFFLAFPCKIKSTGRLMSFSDTKEEKKSSKSPFDLTWRDADALKRYVTDTGKILPRKITRLTAQQQRHITSMIKRGRNMLTMM